MIGQVLDVLARLDALERAVANMLRWGSVDSVDKAAGRCVVRLPSGVKTPAIPWARSSTTVWAAPVVGEQCLVLSPNGRIGSGSLVLAGVDTSGLGDKYVVGEVPTGHAAIAEFVSQELQLIASALTQVSSGGGALTGPNPYTAPGNIAASKTEVE